MSWVPGVPANSAPVFDKTSYLEAIEAWQELQPSSYDHWFTPGNFSLSALPLYSVIQCNLTRVREVLEIIIGLDYRPL